MKNKLESFKSGLLEWRNALVFAVLVTTLFRWSLAEAYNIPTGSMENSLLVGDYILVSKIHYGPRTPQTPLQLPLSHQKIWGTEIPSYLDWIQLPSFRFPGLRQVERGEIVVFNTPKDLLDPTERPADLMTYLVKRCVAVAGDELEIRNKQLYINNEHVPDQAGIKYLYQMVSTYPLQDRHFENLQLGEEDRWFQGYNQAQQAVYGVLLTEAQYQTVAKAPYLVSLSPGSDQPQGFPLFPDFGEQSWDLHNYGPLKVPHQQMEIEVNTYTLAAYGELIQKYEGHKEVHIANGQLRIAGKSVNTYVFQQDYYFMMGDSRHNSIDSRYWGFVPASHVVGKPVMVLFSKDDNGRGTDKIRWNRIFSMID